MLINRFQPVIYLGITVLLVTLLSFGIKVYAASSLPCPEGYWDASVSWCFHRDYMYGYGIYADNGTTDDGYGYGYGVTESELSDTATTETTSTSSESTTTDTIVLPPTETTTETGETEVITDTSTDCVLAKPQHLQVKNKIQQHKIVLRWSSQSSNCVTSAAVHYTVRIKIKSGKLVLLKRNITAAKYTLRSKRLKPNKKYEFSVRAVADDGAKTAWSKAKRIKLYD